MDMKYVTPFLLIAAAYCWQALIPAPVMPALTQMAPSIEMSAAFTRI